MGVLHRTCCAETPSSLLHRHPACQGTRRALPRNHLYEDRRPRSAAWHTIALTDVDRSPIAVDLQLAAGAQPVTRCSTLTAHTLHSTHLHLLLSSPPS